MSDTPERRAWARRWVDGFKDPAGVIDEIHTRSGHVYDLTRNAIDLLERAKYEEDAFIKNHLIDAAIGVLKALRDINTGVHDPTYGPLHPEMGIEPPPGRRPPFVIAKRDRQHKSP